MMTFEQERKAIKDAISHFPKYFGLVGSERTHRISEEKSYFSGSTLYLYTQVDINGEWLDYAKGTEAELKSAMRRGI